MEPVNYRTRIVAFDKPLADPIVGVVIECLSYALRGYIQPPAEVAIFESVSTDGDLENMLAVLVANIARALGG